MPYIAEVEGMYKEVEEQYGKTHRIIRHHMCDINMKELLPGQSVVWGDGEHYFFLLEERNIMVEAKEESEVTDSRLRL